MNPCNPQPPNDDALRVRAPAAWTPQPDLLDALADLLLSTADQSIGADPIVCGRFAPGGQQSELRTE
jgi:hypothetical protein